MDWVLVCFLFVGVMVLCFNGDFMCVVDVWCFVVDKLCWWRWCVLEVEILRWSVVDFVRDVVCCIVEYGCVLKGELFYLYGYSVGVWIVFECVWVFGECVLGVYVLVVRVLCLGYWFNDIDVEMFWLLELEIDDVFWVVFEWCYGVSDELWCVFMLLIVFFREDFRMSESYEGLIEKVYVFLMVIGIENDMWMICEMIVWWFEYIMGVFCSCWWDGGGVYSYRVFIAKFFEFVFFLLNEVFFVWLFLFVYDKIFF